MYKSVCVCRSCLSLALRLTHKHPDTLTRNGTANPHVIFMSKVHVWSGAPSRSIRVTSVKTKEVLCSVVGLNPPSAITVHLPKTSARNRATLFLLKQAVEHEDTGALQAEPDRSSLSAGYTGSFEQKRYDSAPLSASVANGVFCPRREHCCQIWLWLFSI